MELLGRHRVLLKDCYLHYTAQDKGQLDSLDTLSRAELLAFCKDNRLAPRVLQNLPAIFRACKHSPVPAPSPGAAVSGPGPASGTDEDLNLHEFIECVVRIARELHPGQGAAVSTGATGASQAGPPGGGRDNLPRRLQQFLQSVAKYSGAKASPLSHLVLRKDSPRAAALLFRAISMPALALAPISLLRYHAGSL